MELQAAEKSPRAKLIEEIKNLDSIKDRKVDISFQFDGKTVDVEIGFPPLRKRQKEHFFQRQKEFLPGMTLDFNEKTATASVTLRYPIGISQEKDKWIVSGATFPAIGKLGNVLEREYDAAEFGRNALKKMGWIADKAMEQVAKNPNLAKSELFLSRISNEMRQDSEKLVGKVFVKHLVEKYMDMKELEPLTPEINASKKTLRMQFVDRYDEPQLRLHFMKNAAFGSISAEYNVKLVQKEDGSFTPVKRDLSDAAIELQEKQTVKLAQKVMGEIQSVAKDYFDAVESKQKSDEP
ncbi:hypothetical protein H0N98_00095 [Candidatus Micrarchaeota archaeon]|nr:hypothetical protein [Candidatus Micrarchaeota archaeon]